MVGGTVLSVDPTECGTGMKAVVRSEDVLREVRVQACGKASAVKPGDQLWWHRPWCLHTPEGVEANGRSTRGKDYDIVLRLACPALP